MENYESIKLKLKKLLALDERGVDGEARNARLLFDKLCKQYGVSLDELLDSDKKEWYRFEVGSRKIDKKLFVQCYCCVMNTHELEYKEASRSVIAVKLTAYEHAEISSMFAWHKENMKKDIEKMMDTLLLSYCRKHDIMSHTKDDDEDEPRKSLTHEEFYKLKAVLAMQDCLNDNYYRKQLEQHG